MPPNLLKEVHLPSSRELNPVYKGLKVLVLILPIFLIFLVINRALVGDWLVVGILTAIIFISLWARTHLNQGKTGRVTLLLSVFFTLAITVICTIGGGVHDIVIVAYPLVLGFSSILLKVKEIIVTTILSFLSICWLVVNETYGFYVIDNVQSGLVSDFLSTSTLLIMGGFLTFQITRNIKESLLRANQERDRKKIAAKALKQELAEKNQLIAEIHKKVSKSLSYIGMLTELNQTKGDEGSSHKNLTRKIISIDAVHSILNKTSTFEHINLKDYAPVILRRYETLYELGSNTFKIDSTNAFVTLDEAVSLGFCLLELVHQERQLGALSIQVGLKMTSDLIELTIRNSAQSNGASPPNPSSVLIDMMVRQLDGQIERQRIGDTYITVFGFRPKNAGV